ncbi:lactate racemase domain-containing protein, partial [Microbispora bryophytorum]
MGRHGKDVPVWLNREWTDADVRITTGFVEPHFFAGFSGGPKLVAPGLAALETVLTLFEEISRRTETVPDQWQVQIQARIQRHARVIMHTSHLSDADLAAAHLEQTGDIAATVRALPGRVCVLPEGPMTIPYLAGE